MITCEKCGGYTEMKGTCSSCRRQEQFLRDQEQMNRTRQRQEAKQMAEQQRIAQQQMAEQQRIAKQQMAEQQRLSEENHLNEIQRKLVEIAVEGISDPQIAKKQARVIMASDDFVKNLMWFWPTLSRNEFLKDTYLTDWWSAIDEKSDPKDLFDPMLRNFTAELFGLLGCEANRHFYNDATTWARQNHSLLSNGSTVLSKINEYSAIVAKRREASKQGEAVRKQKFRIGAIILAVCAVPTAWGVINLWMEAQQQGGIENAGFLSATLVSGGAGAVWTAIMCYAIAIIAAAKLAMRSVENGDIDDFLIVALALIGCGKLGFHLLGYNWAPYSHVALLAAFVFALWVPISRSCLAFIGGGMLLSYFMAVPAWIVGFAVGLFLP